MHCLAHRAPAHAPADVWGFRHCLCASDLQLCWGWAPLPHQSLLHMLQVNSGSTSAEPGTEDRQTGSKCPQLLLLDPAGTVVLGLEERPAPRLATSPT